MSSLSFLALCTIALSATDADSYATAHETTVKTGRPMLVMVSTDWCAPCQTMKKSVIPQVREHGLLKRVAFAIVNPDRDQELAQELTGGGPVPQLLLFRKTRDGWRRWQLVGGQSVETVEEFINQAVVTDETKKKKSDAKPQPPKEAAPKKAAVESGKRPTA